MLLFRSSWLDFQCQLPLVLHGAQGYNKQTLVFADAPTDATLLGTTVGWVVRPFPELPAKSFNSTFGITDI